jgi:hypothetical protein
LFACGGSGSTIITPVSEPICYLPKNKGGIDCSRNPLGEIVVSVDEVPLTSPTRFPNAPNTLLTHDTTNAQGLFWTTGGGFSNITQRAPYQADVVASYLARKDVAFPPSGTTTSPSPDSMPVLLSL